MQITGISRKRIYTVDSAGVKTLLEPYANLASITTGTTARNAVIIESTQEGILLLVEDQNLIFNFL